MSERFLRGGRLLAFGRGPYATDAQHVSVEFVHPVIVGKRALPALDLSHLFRPWLDAILRPEDIVMGFGPPEGDPKLRPRSRASARRGAMTFALPGTGGSYCTQSRRRRILSSIRRMIEILYHTLWETVHVFFEHRELGHDVGACRISSIRSSAQKNRRPATIVDEVAASILMKVQDDTELARAGGRAKNPNRSARPRSPSTSAWRGRQADHLRQRRIGHRRQRLGDRLRAAPGGLSPGSRHFALAWSRPTSRAIANDVGTEVIFLRQLIAQARPEDVAVGISTSGGSRNIVMALEEARKRESADRGAAGLRRRRDPAPRPGRLSASSCAPTTSRAFRKCRRRSITSFAKAGGA